MTQERLPVVVAESTRLGTHMLEKILDPYMSLRICRDDSALNGALADAAAPRLCLISYLWPDIDMVLKQLRQHQPPIPALLLASPESDAETLAYLCESYDCQVLYRPYEPQQVLRDILLQLAHSDSPPATTAAAAAASIPTVTDTDETPAREDGAAILARDIAFCRRHSLSHSVMVLRIQDYDNLHRELGSAICERAQQGLVQALEARLRQEDALIISEPGQLALSLPGTPPLGARVLAHRLCAWLQQEEFRSGEFRIHFTVAAGIHCLVPEASQTVDDILDEARAAADLAHASHHSSAVHLSDAASELAIHHMGINTEEAPAAVELSEDGQDEEDSLQDPEAIWRQLESMLSGPGGEADDARNAVLSHLTGMMRLLNENERLALVDELLMASALPE